MDVIGRIFSSKVAVHFRTEDERDDLCELIIRELHRTYCGGSDPSYIRARIHNVWNYAKEDGDFYPWNGICCSFSCCVDEVQIDYCYRAWYENNGYTILEYGDLIQCQDLSDFCQTDAGELFARLF